MFQLFLPGSCAKPSKISVCKNCRKTDSQTPLAGWGGYISTCWNSISSHWTIRLRIYRKTKHLRWYLSSLLWYRYQSNLKVPQGRTLYIGTAIFILLGLMMKLVQQQQQLMSRLFPCMMWFSFKNNNYYRNDNTLREYIRFPLLSWNIDKGPDRPIVYAKTYTDVHSVHISFMSQPISVRGTNLEWIFQGDWRTIDDGSNVYIFHIFFQIQVGKSSIFIIITGLSARTQKCWNSSLWVRPVRPSFTHLSELTRLPLKFLAKLMDELYRRYLGD